ncbi:hypothetical protein K438DRAFT_1758743 [Mycena galopus ATCC 62051]|nr:hypothetical protein K438DRAFT_1758743 [Mycena galopus ATCC 62051]
MLFASWLSTTPQTINQILPDIKPLHQASGIYSLPGGFELQKTATPRASPIKPNRSQLQVQYQGIMGVPLAGRKRSRDLSSQSQFSFTFVDADISSKPLTWDSNFEKLDTLSKTASAAVFSARAKYLEPREAINEDIAVMSWARFLRGVQQRWVLTGYGCFLKYLIHPGRFRRRGLTSSVNRSAASFRLEIRSQNEGRRPATRDKGEFGVSTERLAGNGTEGVDIRNFGTI